MQPRSSVRFFVALVAVVEVVPAPARDFELVPKTIWQNVGVRGFYGPWNILVKRNGDYVDYADYGDRIEQYQPPNLPELEYDDVSITEEYRDPAPLAYDNVLSKLNTVLNLAGLADFRTGIRTGDWIDRNTDGPATAEKEEKEEEEKEEGYREDIDSQKVAGDAGEADDAAATSTTVAEQSEIL